MQLFLFSHSGDVKCVIQIERKNMAELRKIQDTAIMTGKESEHSSEQCDRQAVGNGWLEGRYMATGIGKLVLAWYET